MKLTVKESVLTQGKNCRGVHEISSGSMRFGAELMFVGQTLWKDSSAIVKQVLTCNLQGQRRRKSWSSVTVGNVAR